jgi:hypothetical protein
VLRKRKLKGVCAPWSANAFATLAAEYHLEYHCKSLFETPVHSEDDVIRVESWPCYGLHKLCCFVTFLFVARWHRETSIWVATENYIIPSYRNVTSRLGTLNVEVCCQYFSFGWLQVRIQPRKLALLTSVSLFFISPSRQMQRYLHTHPDHLLPPHHHITSYLTLNNICRWRHVRFKDLERTAEGQINTYSSSYIASSFRKNIRLNLAQNGDVGLF